MLCTLVKITILKKEKYLMEHHADINEYNKYGIAILIKAC